MKREQALTLYMTTWQKRMMRDFMPRKALGRKSYTGINKMIIKRIVGKCPMSYKIPVEGIRKGDWVMYLTDEQMTMVREYFRARTSIPSINVAPEFLKSGAITFR